MLSSEYQVPSHRPDSRHRFRRAPLGNALRMKTSLKCGTCIHLASSFNCTLVVAPDGIFIFSLRFFFLCSYALHAFVRAEIQSVSVFVRSEIQSAAHRAIVTLQLFKHRTALLSFTTFVPLLRLWIRAHPTLTETVTHLVSPSEISVFPSPFSLSSSSSFYAYAVSWSRFSSLSSGGSFIQSRISLDDAF